MNPSIVFISIGALFIAADGQVKIEEKKSGDGVVW